IRLCARADRWAERQVLALEHDREKHILDPDRGWAPVSGKIMLNKKRPFCKLTCAAGMPTVTQKRTLQGGKCMRKALIASAVFAALGFGSASAQDTIKIGIILPYSGQFADGAAQLDNAIKLYVKQNGDTIAGKKLEFIRKDAGGIAPDVAKRLAQELIVRDKVDILAGFLLTPNALAAGDVSAEAKKFMVVMNAATSIITTKSPYMVRTSLTTPQVNGSLRTRAYKNRIRKVYTMVSDLGPGLDAQTAFINAFKEAGG